MAGSHPFGNDAADEVVHIDVRYRGNRCVEQRHIDVLALARLLALGERSHHCKARVDARNYIANCESDFGRAPSRQFIGPARKAHQSAHRLEYVVITRTIAVRPCLPKARNRAVDNTGIHAADGFIVQSIALQVAHFIVFHEYV